MAKKDFASMNTGRVYEAMEQATNEKGRQGTASPEEQAARASSLRTQGRKGCKASRINMAYTPENYDFIRVMARIRGTTMTDFANFAIEQYRTEHKEIYDQAKAIIDKM